jgi:hypothetical protein
MKTMQLEKKGFFLHCMEYITSLFWVAFFTFVASAISTALVTQYPDKLLYAQSTSLHSSQWPLWSCFGVFKPEVRVNEKDLGLFISDKAYQSAFFAKNQDGFSEGVQEKIKEQRQFRKKEVMRDFKKDFFIQFIGTFSVVMVLCLSYFPTRFVTRQVLRRFGSSERVSSVLHPALLQMTGAILLFFSLIGLSIFVHNEVKDRLIPYVFPSQETLEINTHKDEWYTLEQVKRLDILRNHRAEQRSQGLYSGLLFVLGALLLRSSRIKKPADCVTSASV